MSCPVCGAQVELGDDEREHANWHKTLNMGGLQRRLYDECRAAGWDPDLRNTFAEEIAHLHEEVSEAFREWRLHKDCMIRAADDGKPTGVPVEFADVLIGMFYLAELHGFDLLAALDVKRQFNLHRSYTAEGRQLHPGSAA